MGEVGTSHPGDLVPVRLAGDNHSALCRCDHPFPSSARHHSATKAGEYHDFKNKKYICGKVAVVDKLRSIGQEDLAKRVISGEFDEVADEDDCAEMKKIALEGGFTPEQCKALFGI